MKKSLVALAALSFVGVASAQSSVTLFGVADATVNRLTATGAGTLTRLTGNGSNASSRLGFRGTEDLGGGMAASFWFEAAVNVDNGAGTSTTTNNTVIGQSATNGSGTAAPNPLTGNAVSSANGQQGIAFNRRATVSLSGGFGEVRIGRDYVPSFWNLTVFDPFGTVGVGSYLNISLGALNPAGNSAAPPGTAKPQIRSSNSLGYFMPGNLGGFYGQAMYAFAEIPTICTGFGTATAGSSGSVSCPGNTSDGRHAGLRVGYANGPLNVAFGAGRTTYGNAALATTAATLFPGTTAQFRGDYSQMNFGASYNFGMANVMFQYGTEKLDANLSQTVARDQSLRHFLLGAVVPVGAGEIKAAYGHGRLDHTAVAADNVRTQRQYAIGYVHNLSKRTALYTTYSNLRGTGVGASATMGLNSTAVPAGGGTASATGFDLGVRHSF